MNSNEHDPHPSDDIFPDSIPAKAASTPATPNGASGVSTAPATKRSFIKPVHVFAVAAAAVMFWAVGLPMLSSHKSPPSAPPVATTSDGDLPTYQRRHGNQASAADVASSAGATAEPFEDAAPATGPAASAALQPAGVATALTHGAPADQPTATTAPEPVTGQQIAALGLQVQQLELALVQAQATRVASTCAPTKPVAPKHATRAHRLSLKGVPTSPSASAPASSDLGVLTGYRLNTIYRGQAWVEHSQKTYVVEAGQEFDGLTVIQVDAKARRVVTAQGEIR